MLIFILIIVQKYTNQYIYMYLLGQSFYPLLFLEYVITLRIIFFTISLFIVIFIRYVTQKHILDMFTICMHIIDQTKESFFPHSMEMYQRKKAPYTSIKYIYTFYICSRYTSYSIFNIFGQVIDTLGMLKYKVQRNRITDDFENQKSLQ